MLKRLTGKSLLIAQKERLVVFAYFKLDMKVREIPNVIKTQKSNVSRILLKHKNRDNSS